MKDTINTKYRITKSDDFSKYVVSKKMNAITGTDSEYFLSVAILYVPFILFLFVPGMCGIVSNKTRDVISISLLIMSITGWAIGYHRYAWRRVCDFEDKLSAQEYIDGKCNNQ